MNINKLKTFLFANVTSGQTIAKNTIWLAIGKTGGRLLRTVLVIYAARVLGAADWGVFSYVASLTGIFAVLTDFGVSSLITREYARDNIQEEKHGLVSTAFFLKMIMIIPGLVFLTVWAPHFAITSKMNTLVDFFALTLVFDSIRQLGFSLIKARQQMDIQAGLYALTNAIIVVSGLILLHHFRSVNSLAYAYAVGSVIGCLSTIYFLRRYLPALRQGFKPVLAKKILQTAWPFAVSGLLGSVMVSTDIFILGFLRSPAEVGYYSAADKTIQFLYAPSLILATSSFPVFAKLANFEDLEIARIFKRLLHVILIFLVPVTLGGIVIAPALIKLVFGREFADAALPLQILLLTLSFRYASTLLTNAAFAYNRRATLALYTALSIALNIIFDLALIPRFGLTGSAFATLFATLAGGAYLWFEVKQSNANINLPPAALILLASVLMAAAAVGAQMAGSGLFITVGLSSLIYLGLLWLFKEPLITNILKALKKRSA